MNNHRRNMRRHNGWGMVFDLALIFGATFSLLAVAAPGPQRPGLIIAALACAGIAWKLYPWRRR